MRFAVEIVRRIREACGPDFIIIYRLSCSTWSRAARTGTRSCSRRKAIEAAGATIINTGIGWHEARMPTIATSVPRAAFAGVTAKLQSARGAAAGGDQPHQHAGRGRSRARRAARPTWCRWRVRCSPIRNGWTRRAPARRNDDQHLHRLQPGLPGPRVRQQEGELPGQSARLRRDRTQLPAGADAENASPWSAPAPPAWPAPRWRPSAAIASPCSTPRTRSAASSTSPSGSRARRNSTRPCAISGQRIEDTGVELKLVDAWPTPLGPGRLRRGRARHRHHARARSISPAPTIPRS